MSSITCSFMFAATTAGKRSRSMFATILNILWWSHKIPDCKWCWVHKKDQIWMQIRLWSQAPVWSLWWEQPDGGNATTVWSHYRFWQKQHAKVCCSPEPSLYASAGCNADTRFLLSNNLTYEHVVGKHGKDYASFANNLMDAGVTGLEQYSGLDCITCYICGYEESLPWSYRG